MMPTPWPYHASALPILCAYRTRTHAHCPAHCMPVPIPYPCQGRLMLRAEHAHLAEEILCTWSLAQTFVSHLELARFSANDLCAALQRGGDSVLRPYASSPHSHSPPPASTRLQSPPICLHSPPRASNLSPLASTHRHAPPCRCYWLSCMCGCSRCGCATRPM